MKAVRLVFLASAIVVAGRSVVAIWFGQWEVATVALCIAVMLLGGALSSIEGGR